MQTQATDSQHQIKDGREEVGEGGRMKERDRDSEAVRWCSSGKWKSSSGSLSSGHPGARDQAEVGEV